MEKDYDRIIERVRDWEHVIIYGARLIAGNMYRWLNERLPGIHILCFAVSDVGGNVEELYGLPVKCIEELTAYREDSYVIVAAAEKHIEEIINTLNKLGFRNFDIITTKVFINLQTDSILTFFDKHIQNLKVYTDPYDYMHLNLVEAVTQKEEVSFSRHYKFPVITELPIEEDELHYLVHMDYAEVFEKVCGQYLLLNSLPTNKKDASLMETKVIIYVVQSDVDVELNSNSVYTKLLTPIHAGSRVVDNRDDGLYDDSGDNISYRNKAFSEMTAMYWIWKNAPNSQYMGLCHYRRHFVINEKELFSLDDNQVDVVLAMPKFLYKSIWRFFLEDTAVDGDDLNLLMRYLKILAPEYYETAKWYFQEKFYYPCNMLIARKSCFHEYCEWIFPILLGIDDYYRSEGMKKENRYAGYLAEMLTSLYFMYNKKKYMIAVTDIYFFEKGRIYIAN